MIKVDLHVHTSASNQAAGFFSRKFGIRECYTEPVQLYDMLRHRGMNLVTCTDHDTIDGALEIAHLPGAFVSEEVTTYFPEDGCKVHVLVLDIDEGIHRDLQEVRPNIYELVDYLQANGITHVLAHPLYDQCGRLSREHVERFLLLFDNWEILNGTRSKMSAGMAVEIAEAYGPDRIERLANRWGFNKRQRAHIAFTGGTDDHGGFDPGTAYTVADGETLADFKAALAAGTTRFDGAYGCPRRLAHTIMKVSYFAAKERRRYRHDVLEAMFPEDPEASDVGRVVPLGAGRGASPAGDPHDQIYDHFRLTTTALFSGLQDKLGGLGEPGGEGPAAAGEALNKLVVSALPSLFYAAVYWHRALDKHAAREIHQGLVEPAVPQAKRVALFTDTMHEVNGVAKTNQMLCRLAAREDLAAEFITAGSGIAAEGVVDFPALVSIPLPEYPEIVLNLPNLTEVLAHVERGNFDVVYASTPGPVGLMGMVVARILKLPFVSTFHTDFAAYAARYTGDHLFTEHVERALAWFYNQADRVLVPSEHSRNLLLATGVEAERVQVFRRGVDADRFRPELRDEGFWHRFDPAYGGEPVVLYVGRVSTEKDIDVFFDVAAHYGSLDGVPAAKFAVVGDGPRAAELKDRFGAQVIFTGYLGGEELAAAYASADLFLFPSSTETFGNVVLEAQASGLPCLVGDGGAVSENVLDGRTGRVIPGNAVAGYVRAIAELLCEGELRACYAEEGIRFARGRDRNRLLREMLERIAGGPLARRGEDHAAVANLPS